MTRLTILSRDGSWSATGSYRYRFYDGGDYWYDDPQADATEPSGFNSNNCVVAISHGG